MAMIRCLEGESGERSDLDYDKGVQRGEAEGKEGFRLQQKV